MGCFSKGDVQDDKGTQDRIKKDRHCTDVLFCLLFFGFWVGMVAVGALAFSEGVPERLLYGIDSYGMQCGMKNTIESKDGTASTTVDLSNRKNLHYIDAFDLLDPLNFAFAKSVCVSECPGTSAQCGMPASGTDTYTPCMADENYYCPYYIMGDVYGKLDGVNEWDAQYYAEMASYSGTDCSVGALDSVPSFIKTALGIDDTTTACGKYYQAVSLYPSQGPCYPVWLATTSFYNRCFPDLSPLASNSLLSSSSPVNTDVVSDAFNTNSQRVSRYVSDISRGWLIILGAGLGVSVLIGLLWMVLLRWCAGVMVWTTVVAVNIFMLLVTLLAASKADMLSMAGSVGEDLQDSISGTFVGDPTDDDRKVWEIVTYCLAAASGLLFLFTLLMIRRLMVAIACLKVASQAVGAMPLILIWPVVPFMVYCCFIIYWSLVAAYLYSTGNVVEVWETGLTTSTYNLCFLYGTCDSADASLPPPPPSPPSPPPPPESSLASANAACAAAANCHFEVQWESDMRYVFLYHVFGLFWTNQFIVGVGYMTVAGAIAQFYWAQGIRSQMESQTPIVTSIKNTFRYHTGSVALGALLVAIVQFVRFLLEFFEKQIKRQTGNNPAVGWALCCCKYCLWYLEKVLKFINRNAYIMIAVKGKGYCASAIRAVYLLVANALRLAAVNIVGDLLIWLGKVVVMLAAGCIAFALSDLDYYTNSVDHPDTFLASPILVIMFAVIVAYVVAEIFFGVYEMAVDTILLSFCEDCEANDGKPKFAPKLLLSAIGQGKRFQKVTDKNKNEAAAIDS